MHVDEIIKFINEYRDNIPELPLGIVVDTLDIEGIPMVTLSSDEAYIPSKTFINGEVKVSVADVMGIPIYVD